MTTKKTAVTKPKTTATKAPALTKAAAKSAIQRPNAATAKAPAKKPKKEPKEKVVRDSFTMPKSEYQKIAEIKEASLMAGLVVKKSEVLRAGLKLLSELNAAQLKRALAGLEKIKTGRPNKR